MTKRDALVKMLQAVNVTETPIWINWMADLMPTQFHSFLVLTPDYRICNYLDSLHQTPETHLESASWLEVVNCLLFGRGWVSAI